MRVSQKYTVLLKVSVWMKIRPQGFLIKSFSFTSPLSGFPSDNSWILASCCRVHISHHYGTLLSDYYLQRGELHNISLWNRSTASTSILPMCQIDGEHRFQFLSPGNQRFISQNDFAVYRKDEQDRLSAIKHMVKKRCKDVSKQKEMWYCDSQVFSPLWQNCHPEPDRIWVTLDFKNIKFALDLTLDCVTGAVSASLWTIGIGVWLTML